MEEPVLVIDRRKKINHIPDSQIIRDTWYREHEYQNKVYEEVENG